MRLRCSYQQRQMSMAASLLSRRVPVEQAGVVSNDATSGFSFVAQGPNSPLASGDDGRVDGKALAGLEAGFEVAFGLEALVEVAADGLLE